MDKGAKAAMWDNFMGPRKNGRQKKRLGPRIAHLKRTHGQLVIDRGFGQLPTILPARLILNDLRPKSVELFCPHQLSPGQEVSLALEHPRPIQLRGHVVTCFTGEQSSRVHTAVAFTYRIHILFEFLNDGEERALAEYCDELGLMSNAA
jgi:hypothetical protein